MDPVNEPRGLVHLDGRPSQRANPDVVLQHLAARQHGAFSRAQVMAAGLSPSAISRRVAAGSWRALLPGVLCDSAVAPSWHQMLWAACAWASPAVASHRAAAGLWCLDGIKPGHVEVSTSRQCSHAAVITHRVNVLDEHQLTTVDRIPTTSVARTLIDLATVVDRIDLECALDCALRRGLTSLDYLTRQLERFGRRPNGGRLLGTLISERQGFNRPTESPLETRVGALLRNSPLPMPVPQYEVWRNGEFIARADFAYPEHKIALECDGYTYHQGLPRWHRDLERRNRLLNAGWRVIHITYYDVTQRPEYVLGLIADELGIGRLLR